jgi:hypothetical protein
MPSSDAMAAGRVVLVSNFVGASEVLEPGDTSEQVAHEMRPAALPARARQRRRDRVDEAGMGVARDELDAREATGDQAAHVRRARRRRPRW